MKISESLLFVVVELTTAQDLREMLRIAMGLFAGNWQGLTN